MTCSFGIYRDYMCGRDKVIISGTRRIQTNLWGVPSNEVIDLEKNCVFINEDDTIGWKWNRPNMKPSPGQSSVWPVYPDITSGTSPWGGYASNPALPVKVSDIQSLTLEVNYSYPVMPSPSDGLNFAYDIWIIDKRVPDNTSLQTKKEIMIWANRQNVPMPPPRAQVSDGINTYDLDAWTGYNAFILNVPPPSGPATHKVEVKKLLDYLVQQGLIPSNWYLAEIALGNEVWKSAGEIRISSMTYTLNGTII